MISKKTINAIELCVILAGQRSAGYVTTAELSSRLGLSISYLENLLKPLKDHHIVRSMKGAGGGYSVQCDLSLLTIWDIATVFEQTFDKTRSADGAHAAEPADYELRLEQVVKDTLSSFTLSDFVELSPFAVKSYVQEMGRFKFKPLAPPLMPKAPNSVFQLHMTF